MAVGPGRARGGRWLTESQRSVGEPVMKYEYALVACARWETDAIVEWVSYHRAVGFEHIYLYCNDDEPTALYECLIPFLLGPDPYVTFVYFPFRGMQRQMFMHFLEHFSESTEWFMCLDIDEFVSMRNHANISEFMRSYRLECDALYLNWIIFGNNGFVERPGGSVLLQYTRRENCVNPHTKMISRRAALDVPRILAKPPIAFWHDWGEEVGQSLRRINVLGDSMVSYYDNFPTQARSYLDAGDRQARILETAVIYHYAFRSERDLDRRIRRGTNGDFRSQLAFKGVVDAGYAKSFLQHHSSTEDTRLRDYWSSILNGGWRSCVVPRPPGVNIALGKRATQSSISEWSREPTAEADAGRVVSGEFSGSCNNHTDYEFQPWWQVDLGALFKIRQIRVYNRIDHPDLLARASRFALDTSQDGLIWETVFQTEEAKLFGGTDGNPLIWNDPDRRAARFVRFRLLVQQYLHLDQVEVYGVPLADTAETGPAAPATQAAVEPAPGADPATGEVAPVVHVARRGGIAD